jgi:hypothetical protein
MKITRNRVKLDVPTDEIYVYDRHPEGITITSVTQDKLKRVYIHIEKVEER